MTISSNVPMTVGCWADRLGCTRAIVYGYIRKGLLVEVSPRRYVMADGAVMKERNTSCLIIVEGD